MAREGASGGQGRQADGHLGRSEPGAGLGGDRRVGLAEGVKHASSRSNWNLKGISFALLFRNLTA